VDTLSYKTISLNKETVEKNWLLIDATDVPVGRLSSTIALFYVVNTKQDLLLMLIAEIMLLLSMLKK
jgi:hypothetical protein